MFTTGDRKPVAKIENVLKGISLVVGLALTSVAALAANIKDSTVKHNAVFLYNPTGPAIAAFRASWIVPDEPATRNDQKVAIWIGLQDEDSRIVLQPVLQWGSWANGSTKGWGIACWTAKLARDGEISHESSKITRVEPGQKVTGVIELVSVSGGNYTYRCYFEGYHDSEAVFQTRDKFNTAMIDYEVQDMTACSDHVERANFADIRIRAGAKDLSSGWKKAPIEDPMNCGIKIRIPSRDSVSIGIDNFSRVKVAPWAAVDAPGEKGRLTERQYAAEKGVNLAEIQDRFAATGLLVCGKQTVSAQLTGDRSTITTSAHVFTDPATCMKRADPGDCRFAIASSRKKQIVDVADMIGQGFQCPRIPKWKGDDWAVLRLKEAIEDIKPYRIPKYEDRLQEGETVVSVNARNADVFTQDVWTGEKTYPKTIEDCSNQINHYSPVLVLYNQSTCDLIEGASGGSLLREGSDALLAIHNGNDRSDNGKPPDATGRRPYIRFKWSSYHVLVTDEFLATLRKTTADSNSRLPPSGIEPPAVKPDPAPSRAERILSGLKLRDLSADDQILYGIPDDVRGVIVASAGSRTDILEGEVLLGETLERLAKLHDEGIVSLTVTVRKTSGQTTQQSLSIE